MPAPQGTKSTQLMPSGGAPERSAASMGGSVPPLERSAPCNIDAEEGLLGCCLLDGGQDIMAACLEAKVKGDYFFKPAHQLIFEALYALYEKGTPADEIILSEELQGMGKLEEIGGYPAIVRLTNRIETTAHYRHWLDIVQEKCVYRRLIKVSTESIDLCYRGGLRSEELLERVEQSIFRICQDRVSESAGQIKKSMESAVNLVHRLLQGKGEISGVSTGFIDLDRMTFGLHPQEMVVLAARPSMGKTSLALNIAETVTLPRPNSGCEPVTTLFFSLEMSAEQLAFRLLCSFSRVSMQKIKDGFAGKEDMKKLARCANEIKEAPLWIDESGHLTILELRAKARRMASKQKNLGLIVIDYLQLVSGTDNRTPREQQISEISRGIKAMAKELKVPVLVLSQLNRESEREKRRPRLSDLRESGSIEQDADVVMLLSARKERDTEEASADARAGSVIDLIIAKQRNGPVGDVPLTFIPELTRFENHSRSAR